MWKVKFFWDSSTGFNKILIFLVLPMIYVSSNNIPLGFTIALLIFKCGTVENNCPFQLK